MLKNFLVSILLPYLFTGYRMDVTVLFLLQTSKEFHAPLSVDMGINFLEKIMIYDTILDNHN